MDNRQFLTRKAVNHDLLFKMNEILNNCFTEESNTNHLPTVEFLAAELSVSAGYLSTMLRSFITTYRTAAHTPSFN